MQDAFAMKIFQSRKNLACKRLRNFLTKPSVFLQTARYCSTRDVLQKTEQSECGSDLDGELTYMLKYCELSSYPRYSTIFAWSRSFNVLLSNLRACIMSRSRGFDRSMTVCGSSTCLTAMRSPVVAFSARYTCA